MKKMTPIMGAIAFSVSCWTTTPTVGQVAVEASCWDSALAVESTMFPWYRIGRECGFDPSETENLSASDLFALRGYAAEICQQWSSGRVSQLRQLMRETLKSERYEEAMEEAGDNYSKRAGIQIGSSLSGLPRLPVAQELELQQIERELADQCTADFASAFLPGD